MLQHAVMCMNEFNSSLPGKLGLRRAAPALLLDRKTGSLAPSDWYHELPVKLLASLEL